MRENPYKYLNSYDYDDQDFFFGRERETRILLSDIAISKLVVLFAKTGTGKTSLLNAGVRPILERNKYVVCLIRVRKDPVESARAEIENRFGAGCLGEGSFPTQLEKIAREREHPLVLFFDQFEEFFLYQVRKDLDKAQQFIKDVSEIYYNEDSGVQIVFSMREEFFVNMDIFRDEIPTIFHYDSNLRLRWFDEGQARQAIVRPAEKLGVGIEDQLLERLIADLKDPSEGKLIEPALLQITCDTLWKNRSGDTITLSEYLSLGKGDQKGNIATEIFSNRLQEGFETFEDENLLNITRKLLPLLRTEEGTKYVRSFDELLDATKADKDALLDLLSHLEKINLVKMSGGGESRFVELFHDYLVQYVDSMVNRISGIWPQRIINRAVNDYYLNGALMKRDDLERVAVDLAFLKLDMARADLLFRSALKHGIDLYDQFRVARQNGVDIWKILRDAIDLHDSEETSNAINLLRDLKEEPQSLELLKYCLKDSDLAGDAVDILVSFETETAIDIVGTVLNDNVVGEYARERLNTFGVFKNKLPIGAYALRVLAAYQASKSGSVYERVEPARQDRYTSPDEPHFKIVINRLTEGDVVPFFGAGVNLSDRPENAIWDSYENQYLPSLAELAKFLADRFIYQLTATTVICRNCNFEVPVPVAMQGLARISQYVDLMAGSAPLYHVLHGLFDRDYKITSVHDFFAKLPAVMREKGYYPPVDEIPSLLKEGNSYQEIELSMLEKHYSMPLLIVTTNYDDLMERAFNNAGEAYDLLWYAAHGRNRGKLMHKPPNDDKIYSVEKPRDYKRPLLIQHPVILKINGAVNREADSIDEDSYVITEDHYIDYLPRTEIANFIPARLVAKLRRSHFLFLGYGLRDWNLRIILHRISGEQKLSYRSWAIQADFQPIDEAFWAKRNVSLYNQPLGEYILELNQRLQSIDARPGATSNSGEESQDGL